MLKRLICVFAVLLLASVVAFSQTETGQIAGTVKDASGAVMPGATVTATNVATGASRSATTSAAGTYALPALKAASYHVVVEAKGFKKFEQKVTVAVAASVDVSAQLTVGGSSEVVEVSASSAAAVVNTENQTISTNVGAIELQQLPTSPTHDPYALVSLSGNVTEDSNSARGAGFSINGQRSSSTNILLDGAENVNTFTASVGQSVPLDSVQEFTVLTNNFGAEYGRASGGVVNLVTKGGTNEFHGSAYEYNRVSALASNTYYNDVNEIDKSVFTRNNFGFSVGGPIKKNKAFFFQNIEWLRVRSNATAGATILDPSSYASLAPSSQAFFTAYASPLVPGVKQLSQTTVTSGTTNLLFDTIVYAVPADAGGGSPQNSWNNVSKIDLNINSKTTFWGRYAGNKINFFAGTVNSSPYSGYNTGEDDFNQNWTFSLSRIISSSIVNSTKLVYNRLSQIQPLASAPIGPTLYMGNSLPQIDGQRVQFPGYSQTTPGNSIPFGGPQNLYQVYDDLAISKGSHQIKIGGQFIQLRDNRVFGAYENAVELLGNNTANAYANLISGNIYRFQGAVYPQGKYPCLYDANGVQQVTAACTLTLPVAAPAFNRNYRYNDSAFYANDTWKVSQRLTVNLGLRWEYYGVQHNSDPSLDSNFVMGQGATIFDQIRNGKVQLAKDGGYFWKPYYGAFGPRVGFAWDVFGDGKTSVRGGYSIGYERNFGNVTFNAIQNPPNYAVLALTSGTDVASMPVYVDNAGPLAGTGTKALPLVSQRAINQNMKPAYAETWNFGLEQQVAKNTIASLQYAGSHSVHLYDIADINPAYEGGYLGDARAANRINYGYGAMNYRSDGGYGFYDALIVGLRSNNLGHSGVSLNANYTWSHTLDNLSSTFSDGSNNGNYQLGYIDAFNPKQNYGNAEYDIRHRFVASASWEIPWAKNSSNRFLRNAVGGWVVSGVLNVRSGTPYTIYDCGDTDNQGFCPVWQAPAGMSRSTKVTNGSGGYFDYMQLPVNSNGYISNSWGFNSDGDVVQTGKSLGLPACTGLYHTGCSQTTDGSRYPARNQFFGPKYWGADMQFMKNFKFSDRYKLQLRAEMYNIFNHHNDYISSYNLDVSAQGSAIQVARGGSVGYSGESTDDHRSIQLGIRFEF